MIPPREQRRAPPAPGTGGGGRLSRTAAQTRAQIVRTGVRAAHALVALLAGLAAWELAGRTLGFAFLPPFSNVLRAAVDLVASGQILGYLAASLVSLAMGYGLAVAAGVLLGLAMGRYRWVEHTLAPFVDAFLATPKLVFVPILYAVFGVGRSAQVAIVFLSAFFVIVVNTMGAVRNVDGGHIQMARAFRASERQLFWKVLLPGALPLTMAGLRLGMGRAVRGMINGEMFIAVFGLGGLLRKYGSRFDSENVFAVLLVVVGVALICTFAVQTVERRVTAWTEQGS
jgi:NitT/TauT family transport system permease protein